MKLFLRVIAIFCSVLLHVKAQRRNCPDSDKSLTSLRPGNQPSKSVVIGQGKKYVLDESTILKNIKIEKGGKLVVRDGKTITISVKNILIADGGELHIGSETCRYEGKVTIILRGKSTDSDKDPIFGQKFIAVNNGGTLELHGQEKLSWTQLTKSLDQGTSQRGKRSLDKRDVSKSVKGRGLHIGVIDKNTGQLLKQVHFDTHGSTTASKELAAFMQGIQDGSIVAIVSVDEAVRLLTSEGRAAIKSLGSGLVNTLDRREPFAFIGVKGRPKEAVEERKPFKGKNGETDSAKAVETFQGSRGTFTVSVVSTWDRSVRGSIGIKSGSTEPPVSPTTGKPNPKPGRPNPKPQKGGPGTIIDVKDDASSWKRGDKIVIASTDWDPYQAEEFDLQSCPECSSKQVKINGVPKYNHFGRISDGVDMRAEVGLLTRNIVIRGEMERSCYGKNWCQFFKHDTFGGHIMIMKGFKSLHISGVELTAMGQQKSKGFYPLHFHMCGDVDQKGGYKNPTYVRDTSIHHCFSRCVTIHTTHGLLVKSTVGYDTLGHCYFLEDGVEQRNTLDGNLGLVTRPGTILPSDRDKKMCQEITNGVFPGYKPRQSECRGVTTFWVSHPNNNLLNNAAAGSEEMGIWYIFHTEPTGPSKGLLRRNQATHSPMGIFRNNRVHSNLDKGLHIDDGVKTTPASKKEPQEYLSISKARYKPHRNSDPKQPRVPAIIDGLTCFKNIDNGAWVRGGDIWMKNCAFADNPNGLTMASEGSWPNDPGSHQEVKNSVFVGESENRGTCTRGWRCTIGGDGKKRAMPPFSDSHPMRGVIVYDGPILVEDCTFLKYYKTGKRKSSAFGYKYHNLWQNCPNNNVTGAKFDSVTRRVYVGEKGRAWGAMDRDGERTNIFHDVDGSVTGVRDSYVVNQDNYLMRHSSCKERSDWKSAVCKEKYAQMYIRVETPYQHMTMIRDEQPDKPFTLISTTTDQKKRTIQYQPVILLEKSYTVHWQKAAPKAIQLYPVNFNRGDWVRVGLCYPRGSTFKITRKRYSPNRSYTLKKVSSVKDVDRGKDVYYFDESTGLLFVKVHEEYERVGHYYHSVAGREHVYIRANVASGAVADCRSKAYPKYRKRE